MTLRGFLVTVAELILLLFAFGTEFRKILIVAGCLGGLIAYSFVSLLFAMITLNIKANIDKTEAQRGETARYTFGVFGIALLPVTAYFNLSTASPKVKKEKPHHSFMILPSFKVKQEFVFDIPCAHIGEWKFGVRKLRVEDLFGFFSLPVIRAHGSDFTKKITISPVVHDFSEYEERASSGGFGTTNNLNSEDGELLGDSRTYRMGDSLKRINWKLSARDKKLYSRTFEMTQGPNVVIAVDASVSNDATLDMTDIIRESALSLAKYFVLKGNIVSIVMVRGSKAKGLKLFEMNDMPDVLKLSDLLVLQEFEKEKEEADLSVFDGTQILAENRIYFITTNPSTDVINVFDDMNKCGKVAVCIIPVNKEANSIGGGALDDITVIEIDCADQIKERVGGAL